VLTADGLLLPELLLPELVLPELVLPELLDPVDPPLVELLPLPAGVEAWLVPLPPEEVVPVVVVGVDELVPDAAAV
jgi:hypothetical protein